MLWIKDICFLLAERYASFFREKISKIRDTFPTLTPPLEHLFWHPPAFDSIGAVSEDEISMIIIGSHDK